MTDPNDPDVRGCLDDISHANDVPVLDEHGYPTQAALDLVRDWTGTPRTLVEDVLVPLFRPGAGARVEEVAQKFFDRPAMKVSLVTGGWSGCESVIAALRDGYFWFGWWTASHRGGLYEFEVPTEKWETPMPAWPRLPSAEQRGWTQAAEAIRGGLDALRHLPGLPVDADPVLDGIAATLAAGPAD